jgi:SAM-dependent methyltransferase
MWDELVCPIDHGLFEKRPGWLSCVRCGRGYPILNGLPHVFPIDEPPEWRAAQRARLDTLAIAATEGDERPWAPRRWGRHVEAWLRPHVRLTSNTRLLELGSSVQTRLEGFRCGARYAVDPIAGALSACGLLRPGPVRWIAGNAEQLPLAHGVFDAVLVCGALEVAADPRRVLEETRRVLRPGGVVWLEVEVSAQRAADMRWAVRVPSASGRLWAFTMAALRHLLADAGLVAVQRMGAASEREGPAAMGSETAGTALEVGSQVCRLVLRVAGTAAAAMGAAA